MKLSKLKVLMLFISIVAMFFMTGCGGDGSKGEASPDTLLSFTSIQITPADVTTPKGTTVPYTAMAYFADGMSKDVTKEVVWQSADSSIVSITTSGEKSGYGEALKVGSTIITATYDKLISNKAKVEVTNTTLQSIVVTPAKESVAKGVNVQYKAMGIYSDHSSVDLTQSATWKSSVVGVATIAETLSTGTTNIKATFDGQSDEVPLIVTAATITGLQVTPADASVANGIDVQYTATASYTDGSTDDVTTQATWSDIGVATIVSLIGKAETLSTGTTNIKATFDGQSDEVPLVVAEACIPAEDSTVLSIRIDPDSVIMAVDDTQQFILYALYTDGCELDITETAALVWKSSDSKVVKIKASGGGAGLATAKGTGAAIVSGKYKGDGFDGTATASVTVN
jgi:hypothetical protein